MQPTIRWASLAIVMALAASGCQVHRLDEEAASESVSPIADPSAADGDTLGASPSGTRVPNVTDAASTPSGPGGGGPDKAPAGTPRKPTENVASPSEARSASDRGVTKDTITLGIVYPSEEFFAGAGAGATKKIERVIAPFIKELNAKGGINGRKVIARLTRVDPLNRDNQQAGCVQQAEDYKVFAALAQVGFYGDAEVCMANKQTPTLTFNASAAVTNYNRERGWVRQTQMTQDRNFKLWIDWLLATGKLKKTTKYGILYVEESEQGPFMKDVALPYLKSKGLPAPELASYSASIAQTPSESASAVLRFKSVGVKLVLPLISYLRMQIFLEQARGSDYKPTYSASDAGLNASDATAGFPPEQWEGVEGITVIRAGENEPGQAPSSAAFKDCEAVYNKYGEKIARDGGDASRPEPVELTTMLFVCQHVALFADAARRAGVNPTRRSYLEAIGNTGTWAHRVLFTAPLTFTPTKYDGADLYKVVRWKSRCTSDGGCYREIGKFRKGAW